MSYCLEGCSLLESHDGRHDRARALRERALRIQREALGPRHATVARSLYTLAGLDALLGEEEAALGHLRDAVDAGWNRPLIFEDPDLEPLRGDPRFEAILSEVRHRLSSGSTEAQTLVEPADVHRRAVQKRDGER